MRERKNDLIQRADDILAKAKEEKRELTEEEIAMLSEIRDDVRKIKQALELTDEIESFDREDGADTKETKEEEKREMMDERKAFELFLRNKLNERDATNMTFDDNDGVIPTTIAKEITRQVYDLCPILERSTRDNVKGKLEVPYYDISDDQITVGFIDEFQEMTSHVGKFTTKTLTGYLAGALTLVSRSLINNVDFDLVGFVTAQMARDIARFVEGVLINGETDKVEGLTGVTNTVTAAAANAIDPDELIELQGAVKDVYQGDAIWIMSPSTRTALRQLKDDVGRYLLQDDITAPFGSILLGKPVYVSDNMADVATGVTAIYYGDMKGLATKFSEEINVQVLREHYATQHAVGVVGFLELDGVVVDQQKIAALVMA